MFGYDNLEDDVAARLAALVPETEPGQAIPVLVEVLPNTDKSERANVATRITVFAQGATYLPNEGGGFVMQPGDVKLFVEIEARKRRGLGGVRDLAGASCALLLGYRFDNYEKLELIEDGTLKLDDGVWMQQLVFRARRTVIEQPDEITESILKQVIHNVDTSAEQLIIGELPEPETEPEPPE
jgi:hypothetical protein